MPPGRRGRMPRPGGQGPGLSLVCPTTACRVAQRPHNCPVQQTVAWCGRWSNVFRGLGWNHQPSGTQSGCGMWKSSLVSSTLPLAPNAPRQGCHFRCTTCTKFAKLYPILVVGGLYLCCRWLQNRTYLVNNRSACIRSHKSIAQVRRVSKLRVFYSCRKALRGHFAFSINSLYPWTGTLQPCSSRST